MLQNKIVEYRKEVTLYNVLIANVMNYPNSCEIFLPKLLFAFCAHWMIKF
jgi:hypothetical protein